MWHRRARRGQLHRAAPNPAIHVGTELDVIIAAPHPGDAQQRPRRQLRQVGAPQPNFVEAEAQRLAILNHPRQPQLRIVQNPTFALLVASTTDGPASLVVALSGAVACRRK